MVVLGLFLFPCFSQGNISSIRELYIHKRNFFKFAALFLNPIAYLVVFLHIRLPIKRNRLLLWFENFSMANFSLLIACLWLILDEFAVESWSFMVELSVNNTDYY